MDHQLTFVGLQSLCDRLARAAIGRDGADGVMAVADAYRDYAKRQLGLDGAALRAAPPDNLEMQRMSADFLDIMRAALTPFALGEEALIHATRGLRSLVHGFVSLELAGSFGPSESIDESFRFIIVSFLNGLRRMDSKPKR